MYAPDAYARIDELSEVAVYRSLFEKRRQSHCGLCNACIPPTPIFVGNLAVLKSRDSPNEDYPEIR